MNINNPEVSPEHLNKLQEASPTAEDILSNLDSFNEEIEDLGGNTTSKLPATGSVPTSVRPSRKRKAKAKARSKKLSRAEQKIAAAAQVQEQREGTTMSLDDELDSLGSELDSRAEAAAAEQQAQTMQEQIIELLKSTKGAPDETQIGLWKRKYGENGVHVMGLGEGDVYVFTHLKRGQWKKIQELMAKAQQSGSQDVEDQLKERVLTHCVLWPGNLGTEFFYNSRAGVVDSLYQVILLNSYFLSPQQAMLLTTQL